MKMILFILIFLCSYSVDSFEVWGYTYNIIGRKEKVHAVSDGILIIGDDDGDASFNQTLTKVSLDGSTVLWSKTIGVVLDTFYGEDIVERNDGTYVTLGWDNPSSKNMLHISNPDGTKNGSYIVNYGTLCHFYQMKHDPTDDSIIITGHCSSQDMGPIVKINSDFSRNFSTEIKPAAVDPVMFRDIALTGTPGSGNEGYCLSGRRKYNWWETDSVMIGSKLSKTGSFQWMKTIDKQAHDPPECVCRGRATVGRPDGGCFFSGYVEPCAGSYDNGIGILASFDKDGVLEWRKQVENLTLHSSVRDQEYEDIIHSVGYLNKNEMDGGTDQLITITVNSSNGDVIDLRSYLGAEKHGKSIYPSHDGFYYVLATDNDDDHSASSSVFLGKFDLSLSTLLSSTANNSCSNDFKITPTYNVETCQTDTPPGYTFPSSTPTFDAQAGHPFADNPVSPTLQCHMSLTCYGKKKSSPDSCSGNGNCVSQDKCECFQSPKPYYGIECNVSKCFDHFSNETSQVCSGVGKCVDHKCKCVEHFFGAECNITSCYGILQNETTEVCNGNGICVELDTCKCESKFFGKSCNISKCFGLYSNQTNLVCNGNGECKEHDKCTCHSHYFGKYCNVSSCFGVFSNETSSVCSNGRGKCVDENNCKCYSDYYGPNCNVTTCFGIFSNETDNNNLCSGKDLGTCVDFDRCNCFENYYGKRCNITSCFGIFTNETNLNEEIAICSDNGKCVDFDTCKCDPEYHGKYCNVTTCFGIFSNDSSSNDELCSNHGDCVGFDTCKCSKQYFGKYCNVTTCFGVFSNETDTVCSGEEFGTCVGHDECQCKSKKYFGKICNVTTCFGVFSNETNLVCSNGNGKCKDYNKCECKLNYHGEYCNVTTCFGVFSNASSNLVCSGNGKCENFDDCKCSPPGDFFGSICNITICYGFFSNESGKVCSGHGNCLIEGGPNRCQCEETPKYYGSNCNVTRCFGYFSNETELVCSGHGDCWSENQCSCNESAGYYGSNCNSTSCFGVAADAEASQVCSGNGKCVEFDTCKCNPEYHGKYCNITTCFGLFSNISEKSCGSHGICVDYNRCQCTEDYYGQVCNITRCDKYYSNETNFVCNFGKGECVDPDRCECFEEQNYFGDFCDITTCFGILSNDTESKYCSKHGDCVGYDRCSCSTNYFGEFCNITKCHSVWSNRTDKVCTGHGYCKEHDKCTCFGNFDGVLCHLDMSSFLDDDGGGGSPEEDGLSEVVLVIIVLSGLFLVLGLCLVLVCLCCIVLAFLSCTVVVVVVFVLVVVVLGVSVAVLVLGAIGLLSLCCCGFNSLLLVFRKKIFGSSDKLDQFEKAMRASSTKGGVELGEDGDRSNGKKSEKGISAEVKIDTSLFEIKYESIKVLRQIGSFGGSQAVIFHCKWTGKDVAFKCFLTRHIFGSQNHFNEFEAEVHVMSSIRHPYCLDMYGCCLHPPRVGIVMEYCEKGDLRRFLKRNKDYPMNERIRILYQCADAMEYLHERKVIHRDIKLENILLRDVP